MGTETNVHIGPYLVAKGVKGKIESKTVRTCSNVNCTFRYRNKIKLKGGFCSECGSIVENVTFEIKTETTATDLCREFGDELTYTSPICGNSDIFISNITSPYDKIRFATDDSDIVDLTKVNMQEEINWFKNKFKDILDLIEKEFGKNSTEVLWGVIQWYS